MNSWRCRYERKEEKGIAERARGLLPGLKAKAPDIGGKDNLDMFLLFLAFYEATD